MLLEYTTGALDWALGLAVAAHLQMCVQCRQQTYLLNDIGGALLESARTAAPTPEAFRRLWSKIEQMPDEFGDQTSSRSAVKRQANSLWKRSQTETVINYQEKHRRGLDIFKLRKIEPLSIELPNILKTLLSKHKSLQWKRVSSMSRVAHLPIEATDKSIAFYYIAPGGAVRYTSTEVTLLLSGCYSDSDGLYSPGDFLSREPEEVHNPTATQDQACVYLAICAATVAHHGLRNWLSGGAIANRLTGR